VSFPAYCRPSRAAGLKFLIGTPASVREDQAAIAVTNRDYAHVDQAGHDDQVDVLTESSSAHFLNGNSMKAAKTELMFGLGHDLPLLIEGDSCCRERLSASVIIAGDVDRRQRTLRFIHQEFRTPTGTTVASAEIKIARH
jgi:hypothetical protein